MSNPWSLCDLWNNSYAILPVQPVRPRDYMYASELGGSFADRYLKMKGEQYTNPPNERSERKFEAGVMLEEFIKNVLARLGVLKAHQRPIKYALPGCLEVSGKSDFVVGGSSIDYAAARTALEEMILPHRTKERCFLIINEMERTYGDTVLTEYIFELKSASSFVLQSRTEAGCGYNTHSLQSFHYAAGFHVPAKLVYICKDDMLMAEFPITEDDEKLKKLYIQDVEKMTDYYNADEMPSLEDPIIFDDDACKFYLNKKIEWSPYLTKLYGFEKPDDFRTRYDGQVKKMVRVYNRCVSCAKMTKLNLEVIEDAKKIFPQWDTLVDIGKVRGLSSEEEEE
jgi:hypothetical protein